MGEHARFSCSGAARWIQCPASIAVEGLLDLEAESFEHVSFGSLSRTQLLELLENRTNDAAEIGTICHKAFERAVMGQPHSLTYEERCDIRFYEGLPSTFDRMLDEAVTALDALLRSHMVTTVWSEVRVDPGAQFGISDWWGTVDVLATAESSKKLIIADLKTGRHRVNVKRNHQLMSYALGALSAVTWEPDEVVLAVIQPPTLGAKSAEWLTTPDELRAFGAEAAKAIEAASDPYLAATPEARACKWCPMRSVCNRSLA